MESFQDIVVLDFTQSVAGPVCTQILGELGADVIKVEPPTGDSFRATIEGASFAAFNTGKKSVSVDLKTDEGEAIVREFASDVDVIVESFRPDVLAKFGLDYESVKRTNEDIVYCSISGFGQDGPYTNYPAYDPIIQAMSGLMEVTGNPDSPPARIGASAVDWTTGMLAAFSITASLMERNHTGEGRYIDASLFDIGVSFMSHWISYYTSTGQTPTRAGAGLHGIAPYGIYRAGDGEWIYLATPNQPLFTRLCEVIDRTDLLEDERFETNELRWEHREELDAIIEEVFSKYDREELVEWLSSSGIPVGPVQNVRDLIETDEHARHRELIRDTYNHYLEKPCQAASIPFLPVERSAQNQRPPEHGEHTKEVLAARGYTNEEIQELLDDAIVVEGEE